MNDVKPIDPSDLIWSMNKIKIIESDPDWPADPATLKNIKPVTLEGIARSGALKFEYTAHAPFSTQYIVRATLEDLGYNRVPLRMESREDAKLERAIDVYRFGPERRFVQLTVVYDPSTNQTL